MRIRVRRREERLSRRDPPVDQQATPILVGKPEPPHVHVRRTIRRRHTTKAGVDPEPLEPTKLPREAVDVRIPVERLLSGPTVREAQLVEPRRKLTLLARQRVGDRRELVGVLPHKSGVRLKRQMRRQGKDFSRRCHDRSFWSLDGVLRQAPW